MQPTPEPTARRALTAPPALVPAAFALVFTWRSFLPTLMPRSWLAQAVITALCAALGYAIGALAGAIGRAALARAARTVSEQTLRIARWSVGGGTAAVLLVAVLGWARWQNQQRDLLAMEHLSGWLVIPMLAVAAVLAVVFTVIGRLVGRGVAAVQRFNRRRFPTGLVTPATILLVVLVVGFVVRDVVISGATSALNSVYGTVDTGTGDGTVQPDDPLVSGSPDSLAAWDTLGFQGREFVADATSTETLRDFHGADAVVVAPIRVYAGLRTADTVTERAETALAELRRTGAFERSVLVITTVTGTGWVDPDAARAIEVLHRGDTAIVAIQYSYLPSWLSTFLDDGNAQEAGAVLHDVVHRAWSELPSDARPMLLDFGQSLGSYGAEAAFVGVDARSSIANLTTRSEGVLFTGPTNDNLLWRQLIAARDPYSPVWRPDIDGGRSVRFANDVDELRTPDSSWTGTRVLYVQHPSDPVTFWSMDTLWSKPEWMDPPRGGDVPRRGGWFPVVTWVQGVFDLMAGFGAPPGHGHDYQRAFAGAWSQIAPPDGWTAADTERLERFLAEIRPVG